MSADSPIGILDSGIGGLSFLRLVRERLPHERIIYIADSAYFPYGALSPAQIEERLRVVGEQFRERGVKAIVVACNSATANGIDALRAALDLPVIGVEPAIKPAVMFSPKKIIGVWTTPATAASDRFARLIDAHRDGAYLIVEACTGLAEAIENRGPGLDEMIDRYLKPVLAEGADSLVLGCTHYELVTQRILERARSPLKIFEPSTGALRQLMRVLEERKLLRDVSMPGSYELGSTGNEAAFLQVAKPWLPLQQAV